MESHSKKKKIKEQINFLLTWVEEDIFLLSPDSEPVLTQYHYSCTTNKENRAVNLGISDSISF